MRKARFIAEHGGAYHVILKAAGPRMLFTEDRDKADFLAILERSARFSGVEVFAYALLDNHFHLLVDVPDRESVPLAESPEFAARLEALYGAERAKRIQERWEHWEDNGLGADAARERDRLRKRMHDLGQFVKTLKEWHARVYREAHNWEGTFWRGRFKSVYIGESYRAYRTVALYIVMNPVRANIVKRGTDSLWTSYGRSREEGSFGWRCHRALLRELARLASTLGTGSVGTDSIAKGFDRAMRRAEEVPRDAVQAKIARGKSLSLEEMLVCRVRALGNGVAVGDQKSMESVPVAGKRVTAVPLCGDGLFTATRMRGDAFRVA